MRIYGHILMAAALSAAACTGKEAVPEASDSQITFSISRESLSAHAVKAESSSALPASSSFGSCAWLRNSADAAPTLYIPGELISCKDNVWKAWGENGREDHSYYWPKSGSLSFLGWAPYSLIDNGLSAEPEGLSLTGWNTLSSQDDIIAASTERSCEPPHSAVAMTFAHALAGLSFIFKISNDPADKLLACWIQNEDGSLTISGDMTYSEGSFSWAPAEKAAAGERCYLWECSGLSLGDSDNGAQAYSATVTASAGNIFTSNSGYILTIPQKTGEDSLKLYFRTADADGNEQVRAVGLPAEDYLPGKRYEYTIRQAPDLAVSVSVRDWNTRYSSSEIIF